MSCFVTALSATLGKSLSNPAPPTSGVCLAGGAAAEKPVPGPRAATCRCARHGTWVPSAVRGPLALDAELPLRQALLLSPASRGPRRCPTPGRGRASPGQRAWQRRTGLGAPGWRSGGDLVPRVPRSPVGRLGHLGKRGALGSGGERPLSSPPLSLSLVGNLARRVFVAMGRGRRDPELTGFI